MKGGFLEKKMHRTLIPDGETDELREITMHYLHEIHNLMQEDLRLDLMRDIRYRKGIVKEEDTSGSEEGFFSKVWGAIRRFFANVIDFLKGLFSRTVGIDKSRSAFVDRHRDAILNGAGESMEIYEKCTKWDSRKMGSDFAQKGAKFMDFKSITKPPPRMFGIMTPDNYVKWRTMIILKSRSWEHYYKGFTGEKKVGAVGQREIQWALGECERGDMVKDLMRTVDKFKDSLENMKKEWERIISSDGFTDEKAASFFNTSITAEQAKKTLLRYNIALSQATIHGVNVYKRTMDSMSTSAWHIVTVAKTAGMRKRGGLDTA